MARKMTLADRIAQTGVSVVTLAMALFPFWFCLLIKHLAQPQGFWQNLALTGLGLFFLGALQVTLIVCWLVLLTVIWE